MIWIGCSMLGREGTEEDALLGYEAWLSFVAACMSESTPSWEFSDLIEVVLSIKRKQITNMNMNLL